jgi:hypothetical protein
VLPLRLAREQVGLAPRLDITFRGEMLAQEQSATMLTLCLPNCSPASR